jgi:hypothetical protein
VFVRQNRSETKRWQDHSCNSGGAPSGVVSAQRDGVEPPHSTTETDARGETATVCHAPNKKPAQD